MAPPFGYAGIEMEMDRHRYVVIEPPLNENELQIREKIKEVLYEELDLPPEGLKNRQLVEGRLREEVRRIIKDCRLNVPKENVEKFDYYMIRDLLGYGKIDLLIQDPNVEDISLDGTNVPIYVWHKVYGSVPTNIVFDEDELGALLRRLAYKSGGRLTLSYPILDGILPEGFRVHLASSAVSKRGGSFTIRKFGRDPLTIIDLVILRTLSPQIVAYLWILVENHKSIMVEGQTATGKTTLLNAISMFIHPSDKVITIEEAQELRLPHENWVPLLARQVFQEGLREITLFDLLKSALRQRPDYIIVGEIRGAEAYTLFQAISTGHGGLCSIHAESIESSFKRLLTKPMDVPLMLIPLMNLGIMISRVRVRDEITRRITEMKEIIGVDESRRTVETNPVFLWIGEDEDSFLFSGRSALFERIAQVKRVPLELLHQEMEERAEVVSWMVDRKLRSYSDVAETLEQFYHDRDKLFEKVRHGLGVHDRKKMESAHQGEL